MWSTVVEIANNALVVANVVVLTLVVILFAREPWRRAPYGWAVMAQNIALLLFSSLGLLLLMFGDDYWGREEFRVLGRALIFAAALIVVRLLTHPKRRKP